MWYKLNKREIACLGLISTWGLLGFQRGMQNYDYEHLKNKEDKYKSYESYLYSTRIGYGFYGTFIYVNPLFLVITITKEIYRFEVNIRGLEKEKKTNAYNSIL
jgi:hypothetical protein